MLDDVVFEWPLRGVYQKSAQTLSNDFLRKSGKFINELCTIRKSIKSCPGVGFVLCQSQFQVIWEAFVSCDLGFALVQPFFLFFWYCPILASGWGIIFCTRRPLLGCFLLKQETGRSQLHLVHEIRIKFRQKLGLENFLDSPQHFDFALKPSPWNDSGTVLCARFWKVDFLWVSQCL